jgi:putative mRNA 3-end processing factor
MGLPYGHSEKIGAVHVSFHPAGHVLGSSQIRIENEGHVSVVTGDFKREYDATCQAFEPLRAHVLVTESTFGLPIFNWPAIEVTAQRINAWWRDNQTKGMTSILYGYALGKSQRVLSLLDASLGPIYIHGALAKPTEAYRRSGIPLPGTQLVSQAEPGTDWSQAIVLAVPSAHGTTWINRFRNRSTAMLSGWMQVRGTRRRRAVDRGFVVSDHADWSALMQTVREVQPEEVFVTHGFADTFSRHLRDLGMVATAIPTHFVGEPSEATDDLA